ncbi:MAG: glycosyltransferase family 39 protein [Candidatus Obscuribacterales bacterium]|nr:glycosyltransferase family 39 protein [Candidatus Obscuribacterales bacterium]
MQASLIVIILLYLLVRLPWIFTVPMIEAPDEFAHYWVINYIRQYLTLPGPEAVAAAGPSGVYGSMPPFGYLAHVLISVCFPATQTTLVERFGSLLMGMVSIWAAFKTGKLLFPTSRFYALALPLLLVFHPQFVFVNTYANNDSTVSAAASVAIYLVVLSLKEGLSLARTAWLGVVLALIVLSKYSGLCVVPVAIVFMAVACWIHRLSTKEMIRQLAALVLVPLALAGAFFVRNFAVFNGDALGTQTMYKTWAETFHIEQHGQVSLWRTIKDKLWWQQVFQSFWAVFGYQNRYLPTKIYDTFFFIALAGFAGAFLQGVQAVRGLIAAGDRTRFVVPAIWAMMAMSLAANVFAMIYAALVNLGGPQGRYLFATELASMAILLVGMRAYGKAGNVMVVSFIVFCATVCVFSWHMLWTLFGWQAKPY